MTDELERFRLDGRVAVVSGGSGGIGVRLCEALAGVGARLVVIGRDASRASEALDQAGGDGIAVAADVTRKSDADHAITMAMQAFGRVDVLINAVGGGAGTALHPAEDYPESEWDRMLDLNLRSALLPTQAAARAMIDGGEGGAIVNVGSMWAIDAITATPTSAYSAAQAGRHALTKNLAIELAAHAIRVNAVALAFVETPAYERFMAPDEARGVLDSVNAFHPLGRHGQPQDVVEAILFYASERARWITGTTMPIDGGVLAGRNAPPAPVAEPAA
jgi:NAD(P)-dependent dehydrogenase (short-subunit alcohol dehydrogenase family)